MLKLKIPPVLVFLIFAGLGWLINTYLSNNWLLSGANTWIAFSILGIAGIIGILGVIEFARKSTTVNPHKPQNTNKLVTSGIYRISRNPMYLALVLALLSMVFYWGNVYLLFPIPLFIWYMNRFQIQPEEEMMTQKFGEEFMEYKKEVRRWI